MTVEDRAAVAGQLSSPEAIKTIDRFLDSRDFDSAINYATQVVRERFGDKHSSADREARDWSAEWRTMDPQHAALPEGSRATTPATDDKPGHRAEQVPYDDREMLQQSLVGAREAIAAKAAVREHAAKKLEALEMPTRGRHGEDIPGVKAACEELERVPRITSETANELKRLRGGGEDLTRDQRDMLRRYEFERLKPDCAVDQGTDSRVGAVPASLAGLKNFMRCSRIPTK